MTVQTAIVIATALIAVLLWALIIVGERRHAKWMRECEAMAAMLTQSADRLPTAPETLTVDHTTEDLRLAYFAQSANVQGGHVPDFIP